MSTLVNPKYRHELKFEMNRLSAELLMRKLSTIMEYDEHSNPKDGSYVIRSLYFDDIYNTAYYEKVDGVKERKKYRIRFYNFDDSFITIELKGKTGDTSYKLQDKITKKEVQELLEKKYDKINTENREVLQQFLLEDQMRNIVPSILVDYKRVAYCYPVEDVRITFDSEIAAGKFHDDFFDPNCMREGAIEKDLVVLEVKYNDALPVVIQEMIESVPASRIALSKFALCRALKGDV